MSTRLTTEERIRWHAEQAAWHLQQAQQLRETLPLPIIGGFVPRRSRPSWIPSGVDSDATSRFNKHRNHPKRKK